MKDKYTPFVRGVSILSKYSHEFNVVPVPKSFPNGMPDHSTQVCCSFDSQCVPNASHTHELKALGWKSQDGGYLWELVI